MRLQRSLAGLWQFQLDPGGVLRPDQLAPDREIPVPLPWQAAFHELESYIGHAWYQTTLELDDEWLSGELLLHFGAVDYACEVYVNGQKVGAHEGGYTAFEFPIRAFVHPGANVLAVRVFDTVKREVRIPRWPELGDGSALPKQDDLPHGKQTWYLDASGIWQDVTLTAVPASYVDSVKIVPDIHGTAKITVTLSGKLDGATLDATINGATAHAEVKAGQAQVELTVKVNDVRLWTPESPTLYTAAITLTSGDQKDSTSVRFGFREIAVRGGKILLNGEPLMLLSALDQDFYPETIYTPPSEAYLRDEFQKAKALGLNNLRCHIKPPDPLYLDLADEMGLLVWAEIPSWRTYQPKTGRNPQPLPDAVQARVKQTLEEMIARDFNHPSLVIWTIVNEDWGTELPLNPFHRQWLLEMVTLCKQLDPTRLVVDNSPCGNGWGASIHVKTDLNDFHIYTNIPEQAEAFADFIDQFDLRPSWLFALEMKSNETGQEPMVLSEFGNWGLPGLSAIAPNGEPDWFKLGPWSSGWDGDPGYPVGLLNRFAALGLDKIWPSYEALATATQWHQFAAMKYEIETMRRHANLQGYVITEMTDIYWEANGLLDFARAPKAYFDEFHHVNNPDVIVPQLARYAVWDDEPVQATLHVSHYGAEPWSSTNVKVAFGAEQQTFPLPALPRGDVRAVDEFWSNPAASAQSATQVLTADVVAADGRVLAHSASPVLVLPSSQRAAAYTQPVDVVSRSGSILMNDLRYLGYQVGEGDASRLIIADTVTAELLQRIADGGDALYLCEGNNPFLIGQGRGGSYGGNWMTSFSWLRPGVYRRLPESNPVTLPFMGLMPERVFLGFPADDPTIQSDVLAGQFTGWLGHPAAHTVQFRYGRGRVIMTAYRLKGALQTHPVAVAMLHDLVDHLASDACQPTLRVK